MAGSFTKLMEFQTMSWTTINIQHISLDYTVTIILLIFEATFVFFFCRLGMQVSSRMCISKDVPCLSFRHSAICFSKYSTFGHANKQSRLYHSYNIHKKIIKDNVEKKIIKHFARQQRTRTLENFYLNNICLKKLFFQV